MKAQDRGPRQPWHYDGFAGRPEWSTEPARQRVIQRQQENLTAKSLRRESKSA